MTLLSVVKDVCAAVGVVVPTSVFSSITSNRTMIEMLALANEMAQRIAYDNRDWTKLKKTAVYNGDGTTTGFNLPLDFQRMLLSANLYLSNAPLQAAMFVPDTDEWLHRRMLNRLSSWGEWTMLGNQMLIQPAMGTGVTATYAYVHKNCVTLASGGSGDSFMADGDSFALGDRLLKLGMIWQWRAQKGAAYAEDMGTYEDALNYAKGHDGPAPIIVGRRPLSNAMTAGVAYPYPVPTP